MNEAVIKNQRKRKTKNVCESIEINNEYAPEKMIPYLLETVREVIEISRRPVPVLDKSGQPTGATEYQAATVLKACELMAKLLGSIQEKEKGDGFCVQLVSYKDCKENDEDGIN